ncbi:hypothetical protein SAMN05444392_101514 [Seinonella peptonophila]|uniref:Uncharacterized protein n=2 Tax=Seinonella peptonophila TaxID=112248 RepID=A0A1M4TL03_9BACL|nr:hypothetical protein SAMN05444392_101514 [Seinonella peptonophila]
MVTSLVISTILAVYGTVYNKKTKNMPGMVIGGAFTLGLGCIALLAVYDFIFGVDSILPYVPW